MPKFEMPEKKKIKMAAYTMVNATYALLRTLAKARKTLRKRQSSKASSNNPTTATAVASVVPASQGKGRKSTVTTPRAKSFGFVGNPVLSNNEPPGADNSWRTATKPCTPSTERSSTPMNEADGCMTK